MLWSFAWMFDEAIFLKFEHSSFAWTGLIDCGCIIPSSAISNGHFKPTCIANISSLLEARLILNTLPLMQFANSRLWPYRRYFQLHIHRIASRKGSQLHLAIANQSEYWVKYQKQSRDLNLMSPKGNIFFLLKWSEAMCSLLDLEWCAHFEHIVQSHHIICHFYVHSCYKLCHIRCGPIVGTSSSTDNFGCWIISRNCLIKLAIADHEDCHSKFHNCSN